jgi:hypothetical protein
MRSGVVFGIENERFFEMYIDLLTRLVPVVKSRDGWGKERRVGR